MFYFEKKKKIGACVFKRPFFLPSFSAGKFHIFKQPVTKRKKLKLFQNCEKIFFYGWLQSLILANKS